MPEHYGQTVGVARITYTSRRKLLNKREIS
jgi:hypothetical protein